MEKVLEPQVAVEPVTETPFKVQWYRTPLPRETLAKLNAKSDFKGFLQAGGHFGLMCCTGALVLYGAYHWPWWTVPFLLLLHGTVCSFAINGVHELVHKSVFKTQWLNQFFLRIFGFVGWIHFEHFYNSHVRHHQFTLHPPEDLEVVLPLKVVVKHFFKYGFIAPKGPYYHIKNCVRLARGKFEGEWERRLFPDDVPEKQKPIIGWARTLLVSHGLVFAVSMVEHWWLVPVVVSFTNGYGALLFLFCNNTQHVGLQDKVPDFRLCTRSFTVNPIVEFLYWHMNYHIEHHMYAAVPCYNLKQLHQAIEHDLPPTANGLWAVWQQIIPILKTQTFDPNYQYVVELPGEYAV